MLQRLWQLPKGEDLSHGGRSIEQPAILQHFIKLGGEQLDPFSQPDEVEAQNGPIRADQGPRIHPRAHQVARDEGEPLAEPIASPTIRVCRAKVNHPPHRVERIQPGCKVLSAEGVEDAVKAPAPGECSQLRRVSPLAFADDDGGVGVTLL